MKSPDKTSLAGRAGKLSEVSPSSDKFEGETKKAVRSKSRFDSFEINVTDPGPQAECRHRLPQLIFIKEIFNSGKIESKKIRNNKDIRYAISVESC